MILVAKMPGQMGHYMFGFQKGMMAAGRMYHDFAHAVDVEHPDDSNGYMYPRTPDMRRADARGMFPSGDT